MRWRSDEKRSVSKGTTMHHVKPLIALSLFVLLSLGCQGGGSDDASDNCEDLCDAYDDCNLDIFGGVACGAVCNSVDDLEDEVSNACEEALTDLFGCAEDLDCNELDDPDPGSISDLDDLIEQIFAGECSGELAEVDSACGDPIGS